jgi:hypothetical protein
MRPIKRRRQEQWRIPRPPATPLERVLDEAGKRAVRAGAKALAPRTTTGGTT